MLLQSCLRSVLSMLHVHFVSLSIISAPRVWRSVPRQRLKHALKGGAVAVVSRGVTADRRWPPGAPRGT